MTKRIVEKVTQMMQYCNELEQQVQQNITHAKQLMEAVLRIFFGPTCSNLPPLCHHSDQITKCKQYFPLISPAPALTALSF
jgi:hypothetical protein